MLTVKGRTEGIWVACGKENLKETSPETPYKGRW